jgi:hypothetical protein
MPVRSARSTPSQRLKLAQLEEDLQEAFDALDSRFWATRDQRTSYETVLRHLRAWSHFEENNHDNQ